MGGDRPTPTSPYPELTLQAGSDPCPGREDLDLPLGYVRCVIFVPRLQLTGLLKVRFRYRVRNDPRVRFR